MLLFVNEPALCLEIRAANAASEEKRLNALAVTLEDGRVRGAYVIALLGGVSVGWTNPHEAGSECRRCREHLYSLAGSSIPAGDPQKFAQGAMITATCGLGLLNRSSVTESFRVADSISKLIRTFAGEP